MKRSIILAACLLSLTVPAAQEDIVWAQTAPVMTSLSATTLPRSGRLIIQGSGFGAAQGSGSVEIGGAPAIVTRWAGTSITAYVPEAAPLGTVAVQVLTGGNASNTLPLSVAVRQQNGVVKWQFQADSDYILQRPALSPDGTIVVHDSGGFVYSLQPDGALKWVFKTPAFAYGPPTVGADGSIYVASLDTIYALDSAGNLKWQFSDPGSQGAIAGPTVGPDGNIYVVNDLNGLGGFALSPNGQLLWSNVGNPVMYEYGQIGAEIVFGPSVPGGPVNRFYVAFDRRLDPHRWAFDLNGHQKWSTTTGGQADPFAQFQAQLAVGPNGTVYHTNLVGTLGWSVQAIRPTDGSVLWTYYQFPGNDYSPPDVGPGGTIYVARNLSFLDALNPNGTLLWEFSDGSIVDQPIASPAGDIVFAGGRPNFGMPGFIRAYSTVTGQPLWSLDLGTANGGNAILYSRSRFTSDGSAVYFGTAILGQSSINPFSYLYAIDTTATPPAFLMTLTLDATTVVGAMPSTGTVTLSAPAPSGGVVVTLTSSNTAVASVPPSVTVAAGQSSETFTVTTFNIGITTTSTISGYYNGGTASAVLTVTAGPTQAKLSSVSLSPTTVTGGSTATGTVRLTGPAPARGAIVRLSSSKPRVAAVPASVTVPAGATSATFTVTTKRATATTALIRGSFGGVSRQATLTVTRGDAVLSP